MIQPVEITFDTNCSQRIALPSRRAGHPQELYLEKLDAGIRAGLIHPFFADISLLESIPRKERKRWFTSAMRPKVILQTFEPTEFKASGVQLANSTYSFDTTPIVISTELQDEILAALNMGFRFIRVQRIMFSADSGTFGVTFPISKQLSKNDIDVVQHRIEEALAEIESREVGSGYVRRLSKENKLADTSLRDISDLLAFADSDNPKVVKAVGEWADGDLVAAHYGYGHKFLCTLDDGSGLGKHAIFNQVNRSWLNSMGIEIVDPEELVKLLEL